MRDDYIRGYIRFWLGFLRFYKWYIRLVFVIVLVVSLCLFLITMNKGNPFASMSYRVLELLLSSVMMLMGWTILLTLWRLKSCYRMYLLGVKGRSDVKKEYLKYRNFRIKRSVLKSIFMEDVATTKEKMEAAICVLLMEIPDYE